MPMTSKKTLAQAKNDYFDIYDEDPYCLYAQSGHLGDYSAEHIASCDSHCPKRALEQAGKLLRLLATA